MFPVPGITAIFEFVLEQSFKGVDSEVHRESVAKTDTSNEDIQCSDYSLRPTSRCCNESQCFAVIFARKNEREIAEQLWMGRAEQRNENQ